MNPYYKVQLVPHYSQLWIWVQTHISDVYDYSIEQKKQEGDKEYFFQKIELVNITVLNNFLIKQI